MFPGSLTLTVLVAMAKIEKLGTAKSPGGMLGGIR